MRTTMKKHMDGLTGVSERAGIVHVTAAVTILPHQKNVKAITSGAGAYSITLPAPEEVAGEFMFIDFVTKLTDDITVLAANKGVDVVLNATGEHILVYSTGNEFIVPYANGPTI